MTLTTGLAPVAPAAVDAVDAVQSARLRSGLGVPPLLALLVAADVLAAACAAVLGAVLAPAWSTAALPLVAGAWPVAVRAAGGYPGSRSDRATVRPRALLTAGAVLALLAWCVLALAPGTATTTEPRVLASSALLVAGLSPLASIALRGLLVLALPRRPVRVVLVGHPAELHRLVHEADRARRPSYEPVAVWRPGLEVEVGPDPAVDPWLVPAYHAAETGLRDVVEQHRADVVVVVPGQGVGPAELRRWGSWLRDLGVELHVTTGLRDVAAGRLGLSTMGGVGLLTVRHAAPSLPTRVLRSVLDRVLAVVLLVLLAPVLGLLMLLVRRDSPGPALFRQTRVGRHGRQFLVVKLRTMYLHADRLVDELAEVNESDPDGLLFKIRKDPRVTPIGLFLRSTSLDELPQLLNVIRGDMSLVGPRPALPREVDAYDDDLRRRLDVKPGMTGLWQVSGRSDLTWAESVRLDLGYVDNWSWTLDAKIALRTAGAVLSRRGAY